MTPDGRLAATGGLLVRIYALASDRVGGESFAAAIVAAARQARLAGATVLPGAMGFGRHGLDSTLAVATYRPEDQPMLVEIVDDAAAVLAFLPTVRSLNRWQRLVTLERVRVRAYRAGGEGAGAAARS